MMREPDTRSNQRPVRPGPPGRDETWQIRVRGLHKSFGSHEVLRGIDFDIERGSINMIIGGSGQGKSVLMKHLMGLLKPGAGGRP